MPVGPHALLRLDGDGGRFVVEVRAFLTSFEQAYNSICALENAILYPEAVIDNDIARLIVHAPLDERVRLLAGHSELWAPWNKAWTLSSLVASDDALVLHAVQLASPGFWEFLGKLSPLEVLRQFLQDQHERRKDREYREAAEREQLYWENKERQLHVIDRAFDVAKKHGASESDLQYLRERFLIEPLAELGTYQEHGIISESVSLEPVGEQHA